MESIAINKLSQPQDSSFNNTPKVAARRSYLCVFCKRGFTTAQALGGHMNIHRKDKAKTKPAPPLQSNKPRDDHYQRPFFYTQFMHDSLVARTHRMFNPFGEDLRTALSLQVSPSPVDDIDLELRLGYSYP